MKPSSTPQPTSVRCIRISANVFCNHAIRQRAHDVDEKCNGRLYDRLDEVSHGSRRVSGLCAHRNRARTCLRYRRSLRIRSSHRRGTTHAWVEFRIPGADGEAVLSLDPTYNAETGFRYVVIAIGRDYDDVPPTSGVFSGRSCGTLHGQQRVQLTQLT